MVSLGESESMEIHIKMKGRVKKLYFISLLLFLSLSFLLIFGSLSIRRRMILNQYKNNSEVQIDYLKELINSHFLSIQADVNFLPELNEMIRYKELPNPQDRAYIEREFLEFSQSRKIYDQIRFLDREGRELIRINFNNGIAKVADPGDLQYKGDRYYFRETNVLESGEVYMSPLDLNMENGKVEIPFKPMIRIGTPVFDSAGSRKGVIVLNYLAENFLNDLKTLTRNQPGVFGLLNDQGYWFYADNPAIEWRFMFPEGKSESLKQMNPSLWQNIVSHKNREPFVSFGNLYRVLEINPTELNQTRQNNLHWFLINRISLREMGVQWSVLILKTSIFTMILGVIAAFPLWLILRTNLQRNQYRQELTRSALYDPLTLLPNRTLLLKRIQSLMKEQNRYSFTFGLLFVDLDGFKAVNDTFGHDGGDILLQTVARRMTSCVRDSDLVARLGGDEFIILLSRVEKQEQCEFVAGKILDSIKQEVPLSGQTARVGASIGISLAEAGSGLDENGLIQQADNAMYQVKTSGKGHFKVF